MKTTNQQKVTIGVVVLVIIALAIVAIRYFAGA